MDIAKLYTPCSRCDGTGGALSGEEGGSCYNCGGTGYQESKSYIDVTDLKTVLDDILDKCDDIIEKLNE